MLHYIQSKKNPNAVSALQKKMAGYYANSNSYYQDINFTVSNWKLTKELGYQRILEVCCGKKVAEVGCGEAAILTTIPGSSMNYTGCDFSEELIDKNLCKYPNARFETIQSPSEVPLESGVYDVVFCVFVLEHVVQPDLFLKELVRCCKTGGKIIIFCPDYAGRSVISSQIVGFSNGSGMEKIRTGRIFDGLITGLVNKLLMPLYFKYKLRNADRKPVFLLNTKPACFCRDFYPDADAVYVTHRGEILHVLQELGCDVVENSQAMADYLTRGRNMFIEVIKHR